MPSKMKSELRRHRARNHIVRAAEGGEEVIESIIVRDVNKGQLTTPLVLVTVKEVVISYRKVEQVSGPDAGWIVIVVFFARRRNINQSRRELAVAQL
jgi:hypothetical protein